MTIHKQSQNKLPYFKNSVDTSSIKEYTNAQLMALCKLLDGKATEKDYETLQAMTLKDLGDLVR